MLNRQPAQHQTTPTFGPLGSVAGVSSSSSGLSEITPVDDPAITRSDDSSSSSSSSGAGGRSSAAASQPLTQVSALLWTPSVAAVAAAVAPLGPQHQTTHHVVGHRQGLMAWLPHPSHKLGLPIEAPLLQRCCCCILGQQPGRHSTRDSSVITQHAAVAIGAFAAGIARIAAAALSKRNLNFRRSCCSNAAMQLPQQQRDGLAAVAAAAAYYHACGSTSAAAGCCSKNGFPPLICCWRASWAPAVATSLQQQGPRQIWSLQS